MVRRHLVGAAHDWWLSRVQTITEWADFETTFKKTFVAEVSFTQRYAQMQARCQAKDESTTMYFHNKVRLCQAVNLGITDIKEQLLMGLWSTELSRTLSMVKHKDTNELLADIKTYERIQRGRVERSANSRSTTSWQTKENRDSDKHTSKTLVVAKTATPTSVKRSKEVNGKSSGTSSLQCWNCKLSGHTQRDCPSPRRDRPKCATCHWSGGRHHKTCTEAPQITSESALYATEEPQCPDNHNGDGSDQILHEKLAAINHTIKLNMSSRFRFICLSYERKHRTSA